MPSESTINKFDQVYLAIGHYDTGSGNAFLVNHCQVVSELLVRKLNIGGTVYHDRPEISEYWVCIGTPGIPASTGTVFI